MPRRNSKKIMKQLKELQQRVAVLESKYLDLLQNYIILKSEVDEALLNASHYIIAEKKLRKLVR
ncbi:hypothetical protein V6M85_14005 (plasmid) [Sulfolobus tengchongensis]|uniref:Uncharacterized protein n=1 Tax=Sulfolobus tengchongensis TaxID=207809 RepID=A0AAX4L5J1_9CREN